MVLLSACESQADIESIKKNFLENRNTFEKLDSMIREENFTSVCFAVGIDHIGEYWGYNGEWSANRNYENKISLSQVLERVGLSEQRYQKYLTLFEVADSERVEYCPRKPSWTRIMVHRSGLAIAGCLTTINLNGDRSIPETKVKPNSSREITPLGDGWYLNHDCS